MTSRLICGLAGLAVVVLQGCSEAPTQTSPPRSTVLVAAPEPGGPPKIAICHRQVGGGWSLQNVIPAALQGHLRHGDGRPGTAAPGMSGYGFDGSCVPVLDGVGPTTSGVVFDVSPAEPGQVVTVTARIDDGATGGMWISNAQYSLDGQTFTDMTPADGSYDDVTEVVLATVGPLSEGVVTIEIQGIDALGNVGTRECVDLTVGGYEGPLLWTEELTTTHFLTAVFGFCGRNVFAVGSTGGGLILHYDGVEWTEQLTTATGFSGLWGSSPRDVFAVAGSDVYHYDGATWSLQASIAPGLDAVWGTSASDVFAVANDGTIAHYDGTSWSTQVNPTSEHLISVWGSSPSDVYAVGGTILRYDGSSWSEVLDPAIPDVRSLRAVWTNATGETFVVGDGAPDGQPQTLPRTLLHFDGSTWASQVPSPPAVSRSARSVWGTSSSNVFASGLGGSGFLEILHYDGDHWTAHPNPDPGFPVLGLWGVSPRLVWAVGGGGPAEIGKIWRGSPP